MPYLRRKNEPGTVSSLDLLLRYSKGMYKRVLLKLSGEALAADRGFGVDVARVHEIAAEIADVHSMGVELAIVVGGGNFFRGVAEQAQEMDRVSADHMGMLGHHHQRAGSAGCAGEAKCFLPGDECH